MSDGVDRVLRLVAWLIVGAVGTVLATQAFGLDPGRAVAAAQALTPYGVLALVPVLLTAVLRRWWSVAVVGAAVGLGGFVLATPLALPPQQPAPRADARPVDIAVVNLLYDNDRVEDIAADLVDRGPDVVVFTEYTAAHQELLLAHPLARRLDHRVEYDGLLAGGTAVWSRHPLTELPSPDMVNYDVDVIVDAPDDPFRLWAVHPPSPFHPGWDDDLRTIARRAPQIDGPLVVAGDFNASYWHPAFREVLDAGLTSAHIAAGSGWSTSWPVGRLVPAFVRIDHALTNDRMVSEAVEDFTVAGSDHRGFVVSVVPAD